MLPEWSQSERLCSGQWAWPVSSVCGGRGQRAVCTVCVQWAWPVSG